MSNTYVMYGNPDKLCEEITQAYYDYGVKVYELEDVQEFEEIQSIIDEAE